MLYSLSRKEGWRRYVEAPARERPGQLPAGQLTRLGGAAREEYDEARHDWHANFGILRTPQLAAVHDELELIVAAGRQDPDRVRGAAVIDALPGLGKTTAVNSFARGFDRDQNRRGRRRGGGPGGGPGAGPDRGAGPAQPGPARPRRRWAPAPHDDSRRRATALRRWA
jgi:hypothetical protein